MPPKAEAKQEKPTRTLTQCETTLLEVAHDLQLHRDAETSTPRKQALNHALDMADRAGRALRDDLPA
jgi:hypothetical protein